MQRSAGPVDSTDSVVLYVQERMADIDAQRIVKTRGGHSVDLHVKIRCSGLCPPRSCRPIRRPASIVHALRDGPSGELEHLPIQAYIANKRTVLCWVDSVQTKPLQDAGSLRHNILVGEVRPEQDVETLDSTATGGVGLMSSACRSPWSAWAFVVNLVSSHHSTLRLGSTMDRADQPVLPLAMSLHVFHRQLITKLVDAQGDASV
jgi:hypothetical protein